MQILYFIKKSKTVALLILAILVVILFYFSFILTASAQVIPDICNNQNELDDGQKKLCASLRQLAEEEAAVAKSLREQQTKSASVERDVNILTGEIKQAQLSINRKSLLINNLGTDIELKDQTVTELNSKMERGKEALAQLIKKTNELDHVSLTEVVLAYDNISDFFVNVDTYFSVQDSLEDLFHEIREIRGLTETEKQKLEEKKNAELDLKAEIESQKRTVQVKESEKKSVLAVSRQTEKTYEQILAEKRARAATIRAALFQLRDAEGISFGDALKYAQTASKATGVRAAFILAILKQESDLGKNVGTCNRAGDPPEKKWNVIMPGPNDGSWRDDQTIFLAIVKKLGLDPDSTPLSCPAFGGWGGAMGPSQFIPYTWNAYESRVAMAVGVSVPSPWNPEHAFTATAMYVKELGAAAGGYTAEKTAALKYYAGGNWSLPQNQFYGNSVLNHATGFQQQIDFLQDVN